MTDADKIMHLQHFGTDPTDIWIQVNPKIRIRIPDHFQVKFWCRQRFALSRVLLYCYCSISTSLILMFVRLFGLFILGSRRSISLSLVSRVLLLAIWWSNTTQTSVIQAHL